MNKWGLGGGEQREERQKGEKASAIHKFNEVDVDRNNCGDASALKSIARLFMAL